MVSRVLNAVAFLVIFISCTTVGAMKENSKKKLCSCIQIAQKCTCSDKRTSNLWVAAQKCDFCFHRLLDEGQDINNQNSHCKYAHLHNAVQFNDYNAAEKLLKHGAGVNLQTMHGDTRAYALKSLRHLNKTFCRYFSLLAHICRLILRLSFEDVSRLSKFKAKAWSTEKFSGE